MPPGCALQLVPSQFHWEDRVRKHLLHGSTGMLQLSPEEQLWDSPTSFLDITTAASV